MEINKIKEVYNKKVEEIGDYEYNRWFADDLKKADFFMTMEAIKHCLVDENFSDYLEIGSGPGTWTEFFIEKNPEARFDLIDISEKMMELAKNKLRDYRNVNFYCQDFSSFAAIKKYDLFFSCRALEYFTDKNLFVSKIAGLLKSGGAGIVITKMPKKIRNKIMMRKIAELHQNQILPASLIKIFQENKFKNIEIYPATFHFPFFASARLNLWLFRTFAKKRLSYLSQLFSESYLIKFEK